MAFMRYRVSCAFELQRTSFSGLARALGNGRPSRPQNTFIYGVDEISCLDAMDDVLLASVTPCDRIAGIGPIRT